MGPSMIRAEIRGKEGITSARQMGAELIKLRMMGPEIRMSTRMGSEHRMTRGMGSIV